MLQISQAALRSYYVHYASNNSAVPLNPFSRKLRLTQVYYWKQNVQWLNSISGIFTRTGIKPFLDHVFG